MTSWKKAMSPDLVTIFELGDHKVRLYPNRIAIWRKDGAAQTWDELQHIKEMVWGDRVAIEVYPPAGEVVNLKNTRHLWSSDEIHRAVRSSCVHTEFQDTAPDRQEQE